MLIMCAYFYLPMANGLLGNVWIPQIDNGQYFAREVLI